MKTFLLNIILIFVISCVWSACGNDDLELEQQLFGNMDSLLETNPDSGYMVLQDLQSKVDSVDDEAISMRHRMYLACAENKLYLTMPSDSEFMEVVSFYDENGTSNDKMRARYLMGCIYRDLREAPMAIHYFEEAAECADTISPECDYATMLRIYYQMGILYYYQYFPDKTLECYRLMSRYSLKAGDTYNSIRGIELQADPYYLLADTTKVLEMTDSAYHLYVLNKMPENAVRVFPHAIYIHINRGEYEEARHLMDIFEHQSGVFASDGSIAERGYERYDYARGLYSLWQGETVQAQEYFHRLLENGYESEAYDGFARIYRLLSNPDSVYKYVELSDKVLSAQLSSMQIQAITLSNSLYDYNRFQHESEKSRIQSEKAELLMWMITALAVVALSFFTYRHIQKRREVRIVRESYQELCRQYRRAQSDRDSLLKSLSDLNDAYIVKDRGLEALSEMIESKDAEILSMKGKIELMRSKYSKYLIHENVSEFMKCDSVQQVLHMTSPYPNYISDADELWNSIFDDFSHYMPDLHLEFARHKLSKKRQIIAVLMVMGQAPSVISAILNTSIQSVSKQESCINKILFGESTSKTLRNNLLSLCV